MSNAGKATLGAGGSQTVQDFPAFAFDKGGGPQFLIFNFLWTFFI
jgi:hypothetical protein